MASTHRYGKLHFPLSVNFFLGMTCYQHQGTLLFRFLPTIWRASFVKILRGWRRFVLIVVSVMTGGKLVYCCYTYNNKQELVWPTNMRSYMYYDLMFVGYTSSCLLLICWLTCDQTVTNALLKPNLQYRQISGRYKLYTRFIFRGILVWKTFHSQ